eukprot:1140783-Pelagomonas_calceolata.AAC.6
MTPERAREVLQVSASSSFEEILAQKQKQLNRVGGDQEKAMEVEAAYDLLFMQVRESEGCTQPQLALEQWRGSHSACVLLLSIFLLQSMKKRLSGELEVSTGVRYAVWVAPARTHD